MPKHSYKFTTPSTFETVLAIVLGIGFAIGFSLLMWALAWALWSWALPQVWPTGPAGFITPGFWPFVGFGILVSWIGRTVFGWRS